MTDRTDSANGRDQISLTGSGWPGALPGGLTVETRQRAAECPRCGGRTVRVVRLAWFSRETCVDCLRVHTRDHVVSRDPKAAEAVFGQDSARPFGG